jgi:hypothetical protein
MSLHSQITTRTAPLHAEADKSSEMVSEMLFGETLEIKSEHGEWMYVRTLRDQYEGFLHRHHITHLLLDPTHQICALQTHVYKTPDYKKPPLTALPFLARVTLMDEAEQKGFTEMVGGGWVASLHLEDITARHPDFTETALRFIGTPYLWGGRTSRGLDCSGLVQTALLAAGIPCPRDTKDQIHLGRSSPRGSLQRGDLAFFERHVGIMVDDQNILNATARTMDTRVEKLEEMAALYPGGILACRRITD